MVASAPVWPAARTGWATGCRQSLGRRSQVIDDALGHTLAAASTLTPEVREKLAGSAAGNVEAAKLVGLKIAEICKERNIEQVGAGAQSRASCGPPAPAALQCNLCRRWSAEGPSLLHMHKARSGALPVPAAGVL